jgi:pilus assembly protein Flp/PilA
MVRYSEKGQGLVEYALIIILIALIVIIALQLLGPTLGNTFSNISTTLESL